MFLMTFMGLIVTTSGCGVLDLGQGAQIVSVEISPNTISRNNMTMTDEFTIVIVTAGFETPLAGARVLIQQNQNPAEPQNTPVIQGDTITLERIPQFWFQGLAVGEYPLSVRVFSEDEVESVEELDVASVTVTE